MQHYTLSMTSRMIAIAALCLFFLCVLLFLLGMEIGQRMAEPVNAQTNMQGMPAGVAVPSFTAPAAAPAPAVAAPAAAVPAKP